MADKALAAEIGRNIRREREMAGVSAGLLGAHVGLSASQVRKLEAGTSLAELPALYRIAEALGVYLFQLVPSTWG